MTDLFQQYYKKFLTYKEMDSKTEKLILVDAHCKYRIETDFSPLLSKKVFVNVQIICFVLSGVLPQKHKQRKLRNRESSRW